MIGAICGDILGSTYEFGLVDEDGVEYENVYLMHEEDHFTDDTVLTLAVADWLLNYYDVPISREEQKYLLARYFYDYTMRYPDRAYGIRYISWIEKYEVTGKAPKAINSLGNGSAMRVSPVAYSCGSVEETEYYARLQAEVTHNNSEGIRGACAIAAATKMALNGCEKAEIKDYISNKY